MNAFEVCSPFSTQKTFIPCAAVTQTPYWSLTQLGTRRGNSVSVPIQPLASMPPLSGVPVSIPAPGFGHVSIRLQGRAPFHKDIE